MQSAPEHSKSNDSKARKLRLVRAAVRHDRPDPSVTAGRAGTCYDAVRVGAMAENDPRPPGVTQRVRWRVIWPPGLSSRSSPMRRPSEAQFVVFSLKSF